MKVWARCNSAKRTLQSLFEDEVFNIQAGFVKARPGWSYDDHMNARWKMNSLANIDQKCGQLEDLAEGLLENVKPPSVGVGKVVFETCASMEII